MYLQLQLHIIWLVVDGWFQRDGPPSYRASARSLVLADTPCSDLDVVFKLGAHTVVNFWSETTSYVCFTTWNPVEHSRLKILFSGHFEGT